MALAESLALRIGRQVGGKDCSIFFGGGAVLYWGDMGRKPGPRKPRASLLVSALHHMLSALSMPLISVDLSWAAHACLHNPCHPTSLVHANPFILILGARMPYRGVLLSSLTMARMGPTQIPSWPSKGTRGPRSVCCNYYPSL